MDNIKQPGAIRKIMAGSIGHVFEWFEWGIYGYAAAIIAPQFFPSDNPINSLLATFAVLAVGFLSRPLGAIVLAPLGDKIGRSKVLSIAITMMALATFSMGIIPTYENIGVLAPILLVLARLIQGFSIGAEMGSATTFLVESAPAERRGFYGSFIHFSTAIGLILASLVFTILTYFLSEQAMYDWGWRIPFLGSVFFVILGLYLRRNLPDTDAFTEAKKEQNVTNRPVLEMLKNHKLGLLKVIGFSMFATIAYYSIFTYLPTYINTVAEASFFAAFGSNVVALLCFAMILPLSGMLSDKVGRKPLLLASSAGFLILSFPLFLMIQTGNMTLIMIALLTLVFLLALVCAPISAAMSEMFPTKVRNSSVSVGYNIATALFGGTAPLIATYLISITDNPASPAIYIMVGSVISFFVILKSKDPYRQQLQDL